MLNPVKGNMYSFVTHTWNSIKGRCPHDCAYCYMKRFGYQKPVRLDEKELKTGLGQDNFIFVGSSCDMWADEIPEVWINRTLDVCDRFKIKLPEPEPEKVKELIFELKKFTKVKVKKNLNRLWHNQRLNIDGAKDHATS